MVQVEVSLRDTALAAEEGSTVCPERFRMLVERLITDRSPFLTVWVHRAWKMGHSFWVISERR